MPVEIRELIIKTEIRSQSKPVEEEALSERMKILKKQLLAECKRMIQKHNGQNSLNR